MLVNLKLKETIASAALALGLGLLALGFLSSWQIACASENIEETRKHMEALLPSITSRINSEPKEGKHYIARGMILFVCKHYKYAQDDFDKADSLNYHDDSKAVLNARASTLMSLKRYPETLDMLNRLLAVDPQNGNNYTNRGCAYLYLSKYPEALNDSLKAIKMGASGSTPYCTAGACYYRVGQYPYAMQMLDMAVRKNPKNFEAFFYRGCTEAKLGQAEKAAADLAKANQLGYKVGESYEEEI